MTVGQLIIQLQTLPPGAEVFIQVASRCVVPDHPHYAAAEQLLKVVGDDTTHSAILFAYDEPANPFRKNSLQKSEPLTLTVG